MALSEAYLADVVFTFRKHKDLADKAVAQVADEAFFRKPGENSNSIALIIKHVAGNLRSRWTAFLTTDGDKASRDRDSEFLIKPEDTRANLLTAWNAGWAVLFDALTSLREEHLLHTITIRQEEHTILQAIDRSLAHTVYHVGQIVYLGRMLTDNWQWLTIAPGESEKMKVGRYLK